MQAHKQSEEEGILNGIIIVMIAQGKEMNLYQRTTYIKSFYEEVNKFAMARGVVEHS